MGKRGPKPKGKVKLVWSNDFSYCIGLLTTDGSLSKNGRHVSLVSKDVDQLKNFMQALGIKVAIGSTTTNQGKRKTARIQFGDVLLYQFLIDIGLMPNKTKIIGEIKVPPEYFFDFLRGCFDGDGCTYSYYDLRWKSSFMFYTAFVSASKDHIIWIQKEIYKRLGIRGHITTNVRGSIFQLKYAKADSLKLLKEMYYSSNVLCLLRKRLKIEEMLRTIGQRL